MALPKHLLENERLFVDFAKFGLPGHMGLGLYNHMQARGALQDHMHEDTMEICFLVKGAQSYELDGKIYRLKGGDVFIAFPNEKHSSGGLPQEKGILYWFMLGLGSTSKKGGTLLGLDATASADLRRQLLAIPQRHFRGAWRLKENLDALVQLGQEPVSGAARLGILQNALSFLLGVIEAGSGPVQSGKPGKLEPALRYIRENLDQPLTVPEIAETTALSLPRFKARFREEMGIPPGEFVLREKVRVATRQLHETRLSITEIAFGLGFSSSQYFATVYKRFTGHTPGSERRATDDVQGDAS